MSFQSSGCAPILCAHLLRRVDEKLIDLLCSLAPSDWDVQTVAPRWKVRDVAAHIARHGPAQTFHGAGLLVRRSRRDSIAELMGKPETNEGQDPNPALRSLYKARRLAGGGAVFPRLYIEFKCLKPNPELAAFRPRLWGVTARLRHEQTLDRQWVAANGSASLPYSRQHFPSPVTSGLSSESKVRKNYGRTKEIGQELAKQLLSFVLDRLLPKSADCRLRPARLPVWYGD